MSKCNRNKKVGQLMSNDFVVFSSCNYYYSKTVFSKPQFFVSETTKEISGKLN